MNRAQGLLIFTSCFKSWLHLLAVLAQRHLIGLLQLGVTSAQCCSYRVYACLNNGVITPPINKRSPSQRQIALLRAAGACGRRRLQQYSGASYHVYCGTFTAALELDCVEQEFGHRRLVSLLLCTRTSCWLKHAIFFVRGHDARVHDAR